MQPAFVRICAVLLVAASMVAAACDEEDDPRLSDAEIEDFCSSACARLTDCSIVDEQACHDDCVEGSQLDRDACGAPSHRDAVENASACVERACVEVARCIDTARCS